MTRTDQKLREKLAHARRHSNRSLQRSPSQGPPKSASAHNLSTGRGDDGISRHTYLSVTNTDTDITSIDHELSFNDIVAINEEGHPYIDINKLVYKPRKLAKAHDVKKEKLMWYLPDFCFIVFNLLSLGCSTYFVLIGITTLTWKASTGIFKLPNCTAILHPPKDESKPNIEHFYYKPCWHLLTTDQFSKNTSGYNFTRDNTFPILHTKLTEIHYFGLVLCVLELVNVVNVVVGINAVLQGYKSILVQHIAVDGFLILSEFIIAAVVTFTGTCVQKDIDVVDILMRHFVKWYGTLTHTNQESLELQKKAATELDNLQIALGCCGVDNWEDYLLYDYPEWDFTQLQSQLDGTEMVIPKSCCRPWWIRNLYCSHGAHLWAHLDAKPHKVKQFRERINQEGCLYKLVQMCWNIKELMGRYGFVATLIHLGFVLIEAIAALVLIKNINALIREEKRMMKRKEMQHEAGDSGSDMDRESERHNPSSNRWSYLGSESRGMGGNRLWSKVAPPTEDEIMTIKLRSNFNEFIAKVKTGHVGKWMKDAQQMVTEGHQVEDAPQTQEERRLRDKELLVAQKRAKLEEDVDSMKELTMKFGHRHRRRNRHSDMSEPIAKPVTASALEAKKRLEQAKSSGKDVRVDKVRSRLDTGHRIKKKKSKGQQSGRKSKGNIDAESGNTPVLIKKLPDDIKDDESFHMAEVVDDALTGIKSKYDHGAPGGIVKKKAMGRRKSRHHGKSHHSRKSLHSKHSKQAVKKGKSKTGAESKGRIITTTTVLWIKVKKPERDGTDHAGDEKRRESKFKQEEEEYGEGENQMGEGVEGTESKVKNEEGQDAEWEDLGDGVKKWEKRGSKQEDGDHGEGEVEGEEGEEKVKHVRLKKVGLDGEELAESSLDEEHETDVESYEDVEEVDQEAVEKQRKRRRRRRRRRRRVKRVKARQEASGQIREKRPWFAYF